MNIVEAEVNGNSIQELWDQHRSAPFPRGLGGKDVKGIDFVMLDANIAGCVSTFLGRGTLDIWRTAILGVCYHDCELVLPSLDYKSAEYYGRLLRLAALVLRAVIKAETPDK